ncbi:hypothetical protein [Streptomyces albireticuli]|nr:hypothetical protein [Streptomyces albireticuli]MCD9142435.1 hypothetical protein [Streptomyces albireticuli]MCD9163835.1 hypothetical protein [Streptomyces albireticuli]MCD9192563.1 hypothetical protein [Streptomyces albireticuli]
MIEGDSVVVRYPAGRPERATALPPGDVRTRVGMTLLLPDRARRPWRPVM